MSSCRECCYAVPTGANLYCSMNECYVGELTCDEFEPIVKPLTNADRIRAMSDEELAEFMNGVSRFAGCPGEGAVNCQDDCGKCWLDWLRQEVSE